MQALRELAASPDVVGDLAPEGYAKRRVRYMIQLDREGRQLGAVDLAEAASGPGARGTLRSVPNTVRSSATRPLLLADGPDYVFGLADDPIHAARAERRREAFLRLVADCADATRLAEVRAVQRYLETSTPPDIEPSADLVTFAVDGQVVIDLPEVQAYWRRLQAGSGGSVEMECLICGTTAPSADVWPVLIKGIPGGQTSGNQLVSANVNAFESYGLRGSRTSPACLDCAAAAGRALNWLLERDAHHLRMPTSVFVFWTQGGATFNLASLMNDPRPEQVAELLRAAQSGRQGAVRLDTSRFFAAELSAGGARIAVRSWIEAPLEETRGKVAAYFRRQAIVDFDGSPTRPLSLRRLLASTVREPRDLGPQLSHDLMEVALQGGRAPARLLAAAVRRAQVEQRVTRPRAALLKLALFDGSHQEGYMVQLDDHERSPAYLSGRLLAELEAAQRAALGRPNTTLTDRYYGAASISPASVFGPLLRNAQNHLGKLRRDQRGAYLAIDGRLTDILERLEGRFPAVLTLRDQALFGLGYYHQKAHDRAAARAAKLAGSQSAADLAAAAGEVQEENS